MRGYQLVIGDQDQKYNTQLTTYINTEKADMFLVRGFSESTLLNKHLLEHPVDILLITPELYDQTIENLGIKCVVILSSGKVPHHLSSYAVIFKYQPIDQLIKQLLSHYADHSEEHLLTRSTKAQIIGVYSPIGRSGRTSLSLAMAQLLGEKKKVLYLDIEPFDDLASFFSASHQYGVSDLLYYIRQKHPNMLLKLESIKESTEHFEYIGPVKCYMDLWESTEEEWEGLFGFLRETAGYDVVILNFSTMIYPYTWNVLKACDQLIVTVPSDLTAYQQLRGWLGTLELIKQTDLLDKVTYVLNHLNPRAYAAPDFIEVACELPYIESFIQKDTPYYLQLGKGYGQAVHQLLESMKVGDSL